METIKKGRPQKGWTKKYKCTGAGNKGGGCGAMLLVSQRDLYRMVSEHWMEIFTTLPLLVMIAVSKQTYQILVSNYLANDRSKRRELKHKRDTRNKRV